MKIGSAKVKNKTTKDDDNTLAVTSSFLNTSKEVNKNNKNRAYFNFINSIGSPRSRKTYEFIIKRYMKYYNIQDINELLADKNNLP
jgi:hypothetical protein